jgi:hypothetical protein
MDVIGPERTCVYTALFGRYDGLLEQPTSTRSSADFICFTDDPALRSDTWDVRLVAPAFAADSVRSARLHKILGHESLRSYDTTLYIDASVVIRRTPEEILESWLPAGVDIALSTHSYREQLVDEFDEIIALNYDDRARVYEQLTDYALVHPAALSARPFWTGMVARRWTPDVRRAMRTWADHVLRYSRRDQLSVVVALAQPDLALRVLEVDNFSSEWHQWPVIPDRRIEVGKAPAVPSGPLLADLRRAVTRADRAASDLAQRDVELVAAREALKALQDAQDQLTEQVGALRAEVEDAQSARASAGAELVAQSGVRGATRHLVRSVRDALERRGRR